MSLLRRREPVDYMRPALPVDPSDAEQTGSGAPNVDQEHVVWFADIEPGVRVNLELRLTRDGQAHVTSFRVSDVLNDDRPSADAGAPGGGSDDPLSGTSIVGGAVSEDAGALAESDGDDRRHHGDEDAAADVHAAEGIWERIAEKAYGPRQVRVSVSAVAS